MERTIDVGTNYRVWWFLGLVAATFCLLIGGCSLLAVGEEGGVWVLIAAAVSGFATAAAAAVITSRRRKVQITPDGLVVRDRKGDREFTDEQVICASLHSQVNYSSGEPKSTTRSFDLWLEGHQEAEQLTLTNRIPLREVDPLELLIERILGHLCDRAEAALHIRQPFEGEGWTLHSDELIVGLGRNTQSVRLEEMSAVEVFDNDLCIWKVGRDEPALRVPMRSANAHVLLRLLRERVIDEPPGDAAPSPDRLGRILFQRKPSRASILGLWCLPVPATILFLGCGIAAIIWQQPELVVGTIIGLVLMGIGLIPLFQCVTFTCHEHGVSHCWLRREKRLRYADVDSFTYNAARQYVKGVYSGTTFTLTFISTAGGKPRTITYSKTLRNADEELDHLRDRVSQVIAARMAAVFARGLVVPWTDGLKFLRDELEYRASGFLGRKAPVLVPYEQIAGVDVSNGFFHLWIEGQRKPLVKENVSQPNFFPGYQFLIRLLASRVKTMLTEAAV